MRARAAIIALHYPARSILACSKTVWHYAFKQFRASEYRKAPIAIHHRHTTTMTDFQMGDHGSMMTTKPVPAKPPEQHNVLINISGPRQ
jgi:hypothetical protein